MQGSPLLGIRAASFPFSQHKVLRKFWFIWDHRINSLFTKVGTHESLFRTSFNPARIVVDVIQEELQWASKLPGDGPLSFVCVIVCLFVFGFAHL